MRYFFGALISLLSFLSFAQGDITVHKDPRVDGLVKKQGEIISPATGPEIDGYRIQLFFDSDKRVITEARSSFISKYPKVDTYVTYNAPNFVLKVGDFRTRLEAERVKASVESEFPTSFIVKEKINLPRLEN